MKMNQKQIAITLGICRAVGLELSDLNFPRQDGKNINLHMTAKHQTMALMNNLNQ